MNTRPDKRNIAAAWQSPAPLPSGPPGTLSRINRYSVALSTGFAPASIVTPFHYVQMVGAVLVGYVLLGDLPDALTWLGAAIVIGSGLLVGWTQTRR